MAGTDGVDGVDSADGADEADEAARARRSYDAIADRYLTEISGELTTRPVERGLLDALAELAGSGVIVDAGAGPAHVAAYLAGRGAAVLAADLSPAMCTLAERQNGVHAVAGDLTALPLRAGSLGAVVSLFAVIHLDGGRRRAAYAEFARVLPPGAPALVGFHVSSPEVTTGGAHRPDRMWDVPVDLTFRYLHPDEETSALVAAGFRLLARTDREPVPGEHASRRCYLLAVRAWSDGSA